MNSCVYIHEFIDIIGHNRANYMHHMTANWSPIGQEQRGQLCYGVWALIGSTAGWPQTVNMWEHTGWDGLADSFAVETSGVGAQDPALVKWWGKAAEFRRGGFDRILVPAPWCPTITELTAAGTRGEAYAHELVKVRRGGARDLLERARDGLAPGLGRHGWQLIGAFETAMVDDDEAMLLWAIPTWRDWSAGELAARTEDDLVAWRRDAGDIVTAWHRILLVDSPLNPMKTGRQPSRDDRVDWED